LIVGFCVSIP